MLPSEITLKNWAQAFSIANVAGSDRVKVQNISQANNAQGTLTVTYVLEPVNGPSPNPAQTQTYTVRGLNTNQRAAEAVRATWAIKPNQVLKKYASAVTIKKKSNVKEFLTDPQLITQRANTTVQITRLESNNVTGTLTIYYKGQITGTNGQVLATAKTEQSTQVQGFLTYQQDVDGSRVEFTQNPALNDF